MVIRADKGHKLTEAEHKAISRSLALMSVFENVDANMPTHYVRMFLRVCKDPGKGVSEYARDLGVYQNVSSRILLEIGPKSRTGGEGLGLVQADFDHRDLRQKNYSPTPKGWRLLEQVVTSLGLTETTDKA